MHTGVSGLLEGNGISGLCCGRCADTVLDGQAGLNTWSGNTLWKL